MNTKLATRQIRLNEWTGIIKVCRSSENGLKYFEKCLENTLF